MRLKHWIFGAATGLTAAAVLAGGCSGETDSKPAGGTDASVDQTTDRGQQTTDAAIDNYSCTIDADLKKLNVPDAAINDAGATTGLCVSCINTTCPSAIDACNADCECNNAVAGVLSCVAQGSDLFTCAQTAGSGIPIALAQQLLPCFIGCSQECGVPDFSDGGRDGASDAKKD